MKNPGNVRARAARVLNALLNQQGSLATLSSGAGVTSGADDPDEALLRELCFGTCRWFYQLDACLQLLVDKPLKRKDQDIHCLLLIGLYQLQHMRIPDHACLNETVNATRDLKKPWAKGLVNGILRSFQRRQQSLLEQISADPSALYAHPTWLLTQIRQSWPDQWQQILAANNAHPPMTLRVNRQQIEREEYLRQLSEAGIEADAGKLAETAVYLRKAVAVQKLPGFAQGQVSVQDEASQLVPALLQLEPGMSVLDACSAPGGKTCHLLESESTLNILALDKEASRLQRVTENLQRLGLQAQLKTADATRPDKWWDSRPFDRILLDAPCSASGIIRRQPDIKLLRRSEDIGRLTELQKQLLQTLWQCLKPGGLLLYTSCSILPQENSRQILGFVQEQQDAQLLPLPEHYGLECEAGRQLLPVNGGPDGFYFALLQKLTAN